MKGALGTLIRLSNLSITKKIYNRDLRGGIIENLVSYRQKKRLVME
ncbi:MAG: hypothetical protein WKF36_04940 [Candidatus Nitrosocosmicus sp.]